MKQLLRRARAEDGQILLMLMLVLGLLLAFVGIAVDGSLMYLDRRWMQNGADAAALATAQYMAQTWQGGDLTVSDAQCYDIAREFIQANSNLVDKTTFQLDYLDQNRKVIGTSTDSAGRVPGQTRGVHVVVTAHQDPFFSRLFGTQILLVSAEASAVFGPAGSGIGVAPIAADDSLSGTAQGLQPAGGGAGGNYVNIALLDTSRFPPPPNPPQDFFDALRNGIRAELRLGASYPTTPQDYTQWRQQVVAALNARITAGRSMYPKDGPPGYVHADNPQLLVIPTVQGGFGSAGEKVLLYQFKAFFLTEVDPNGNWARGIYVRNVTIAGGGTIDYNAPYSGVKIVHLIE